MAEQGRPGMPGQGARGTGDAARDNEEHELEAEQESADAMDAEVRSRPARRGRRKGSLLKFV